MPMQKKKKKLVLGDVCDAEPISSMLSVARGACISLLHFFGDTVFCRHLLQKLELCFVSWEIFISYFMSLVFISLHI